ncbi:SCO family protein [Nocardioides panacis]|uniref:SCO family protein n=1 Tax=Nocardioides panacis TaxID=2849501 RepID=A0A975T253_9ACTN|nr:SCO family protein [Nocardioides panacis]QWZ10273.1 SCO family protein [Nocardioides panacis]
MRSRTLASMTAVLALLLAGCGGQSPGAEGPVADVSIHDDDGLNGIVLPTPYRVPSVPLEDADGATYDLATDATKPLTLVFFGYTHCPDICQVVMANIASSLTRLDDAQRAKVQMVFVTTDPARDDVATLRSYLDRFDPSFDGLTGDLAKIVELGTAFDVEIAKGKKLASGGYDVAHGTQIIGLLPDHRAPFVWTQGTDPSTLADDITTILDDKVPGL